MLRNIKKLTGNKLIAVDGEIGSVDHYFFDDQSWSIRYFVVNAGNWLIGRKVLISPVSIQRVDWPLHGTDGGVFVSLTKEQVKQSPEIDVLRPISRQHEILFLNYYDYPYYWGEASGMPFSASTIRHTEPVAAEAAPEEIPTDSHLRSTETVASYTIAALDGDLGHVEDYVVDDESWAIRYLVISTRNWWPGKKVLIAPQWIRSVDWHDAKVHVNLTREAIKGGPEFSESELISREYENQLYRYYGHPGYWQD